MKITFFVVPLFWHVQKMCCYVTRQQLAIQWSSQNTTERIFIFWSNRCEEQRAQNTASSM